VNASKARYDIVSRTLQAGWLRNPPDGRDKSKARDCQKPT
jgi:hypothetical protein